MSSNRFQNLWNWKDKKSILSSQYNINFLNITITVPSIPSKVVDGWLASLVKIMLLLQLFKIFFKKATFTFKWNTSLIFWLFLQVVTTNCQNKRAAVLQSPYLSKRLPFFYATFWIQLFFTTILVAFFLSQCL